MYGTMKCLARISGPCCCLHDVHCVYDVSGAVPVQGGSSMRLSDVQLAIQLITKASVDQRAQGAQFRGQLVEPAQQLGVRAKASDATETVVRALMHKGRALRESQAGLVRDAHTPAQADSAKAHARGWVMQVPAQLHHARKSCAYRSVHSASKTLHMQTPYPSLPTHVSTFILARRPPMQRSTYLPLPCPTLLCVCVCSCYAMVYCRSSTQSGAGSDNRPSPVP